LRSWKQKPRTIKKTKKKGQKQRSGPKENFGEKRRPKYLGIDNETIERFGGEVFTSMVRRVGKLQKLKSLKQGNMAEKVKAQPSHRRAKWGGQGNRGTPPNRTILPEEAS